MNGRAVLHSKETSDRLRAWTERRLTAEEARTWLSAPIGDNERADVLSLVRWFRRRYPTPVERLAYVRRAYARWQRVQGQQP
jgi:hypothetical protein